MRHRKLGWTDRPRAVAGAGYVEVPARDRFCSYLFDSLRLANNGNRRGCPNRLADWLVQLASGAAINPMSSSSKSQFGSPGQLAISVPTLDSGVHAGGRHCSNGPRDFTVRIQTYLGTSVKADVIRCRAALLDPVNAQPRLKSPRSSNIHPMFTTT